MNYGQTARRAANPFFRDKRHGYNWFDRLTDFVGMSRIDIEIKLKEIIDDCANDELDISKVKSKLENLKNEIDHQRKDGREAMILFIIVFFLYVLSLKYCGITEY